jgi:hypothetical protein
VISVILAIDMIVLTFVDWLWLAALLVDNLRRHTTEVASGNGRCETGAVSEAPVRSIKG